MDFSKVNYDGDLEDAERDDLMSLVSQFEAAQEQNVAEFESAQEQIQELTGDADSDFAALIGEVQDFADAKTAIVSEITEFESFDASPVSEDDLTGASFGRLREYHVYFAGLDAEADAAEQDGDEVDEESGEFNDMGKRAETHVEDDDEDFARTYLAGMPGFMD